MTLTTERADRVEQFVRTRVEQLQVGYRQNRSSAVSALAQLRRGVGTAFGSDLELLGLALAGIEESLYDDIGSLPDDPTPEEQAAYSAITLYALHQQSRRETPMHRRGYSIGRSARLLSRKVNNSSVHNRFAALGTSSSWNETTHHARGLIQQFRQHRIPLDYGKFARDLYGLRGPYADSIRMSWGRDYFRQHHPDDDTDNTPAPAPDTTN